MSIENINHNPHMIKMWINNAKEAAEQYYSENPDSLIPGFEKMILRE